ncbi:MULTISPECIES: hypothetical protein [unclassified Streptomyces]|uniref:hypothetical protein n=1 Tax=unclassified Streptomyces TaxID=2593676 RepID=UPI0022528717|nr:MULTISPECIES: hypothetical protein [unclassified Streptomyces]MCX4863499.1 hypothetical protein [Streptomyces sp. NBC_00906]MCX4894737.1 hypothetical protein [Streptomyces sp. NBC_00892]
MNRTEPQHGERRCYLRGCRRPECEQANYRYMSRLRLDNARGQHRRIASTQTIAHVERLIANGWNQTQIASAAGLGERTVGQLLQGRAYVYVGTARSILAIHVGPPPYTPRNVDATGSRRRIQALVAIGWPLNQLAPRVGLNVFALGHIANGDLQQVRSTTAALITRHYRQLSRTPGENVRARKMAQKRGWHGPLAWDDIDDPKAQPETEKRREGGPGRREKVDDREVARLTAAGKTAEQIAQELRCHKRTVVRARGRVHPETAQAA